MVVVAAVFTSWFTSCYGKEAITRRGKSKARSGTWCMRVCTDKQKEAYENEVWLKERVGDTAELV